MRLLLAFQNSHMHSDPLVDKLLVKYVVTRSRGGGGGGGGGGGEEVSIPIDMH